MNGDLSLSQALGGLRIANPDDASPSPPRETREPAETATDSDRNRDLDRADRSAGGPHSSGISNPQPATRSPHTFESAAAILKNAQENLAARGLPPPNPSNPHDREHQSQLGPSFSVRSAASRPVSHAYGATAEPDHREPAHGALRNEPSRSSMYSQPPARSDSRSVPLNVSQPPSRQPSRRGDGARHGPMQPAGPNGPLPPRRSSKGVTSGGYASVPGVPMAPPGSSFEPHMGPLQSSSEEWKDRGAAVSMRKEVDAEGRTVVKSIKKGVRDFSFGRVLGEGSYSTVYLATDRQTLREYAIKVLEKKHIIKEKKIKYVNIEKNTLNRLTEHPGIVRLYYTFQDETSLYYVLDLCGGGELLGFLKKTGTFSLECSRFYGAQILDAIEYMHSRGVIHRDLKPENVLLDDKMHVKITDFGTAKLLPDPRDPRPPADAQGQIGGQDDQRAASFVGTAEYVSPELLTEKAAGKPSDIWAFGCIIYQLLAGRPPFKAGTEYLTFQKIVALEYDFPQGFPAAGRDLVERCLVLDPGRRVTIEHIKNHEFFDGHPFGKELWRMKAPRLKPYVPNEDPHIIQLNGGSANTSQPQAIGTPRVTSQAQSNGSRPARIITEVPPPTQLDIEWSPVLTRTNERILKLGDQLVISSPLPNGAHGRGDDGHKKLSRFFGGSTTKKRQRLVMITSSGRVVLAPAGGDEKRAKQEISLLSPDCTWRTQVDVKGQNVWCIDVGGTHYSFEEPKSSSTASSSSSDLGKPSVQDWIESLERAKDMALSQNLGDGGFGDVSSSYQSSPSSTLGGRLNFPEGFSINDRSGRNVINKSQTTLDDASSAKRNRFSKRQSKNGLGAAF